MNDLLGPEREYLTVPDMEYLADTATCPAELIPLMKKIGVSPLFLNPLIRLWGKSYDDSHNYQMCRKIEQGLYPH